MSNTLETVIVIVSGWKFGKKYTCVSCGKGKFEANQAENACPKCGQLHTIKVQL